MSHYYLITVIPPSTPPDQMEGLIDSLMEPYSENLEVEEYDEECYCIGSNARAEAGTQAEAELDTSANKLREQYQRDTAQDWKVLSGPFFDLIDKRFEEHPKKADPASDCCSCEGTGSYRSTSNPNGNWDWYRIGGRWDGTIKNNYQSSQNGFNFDQKHQTLENNLIPVKAALDNWDAKPHVPYALLTHDGKWLAKGEMGWFGCSNDNMTDEQWEAQVKAFYADHLDYLLVGMDCHT